MKVPFILFSLYLLQVWADHSEPTTGNLTAGGKYVMVDNCTFGTSAPCGYVTSQFPFGAIEYGAALTTGAPGGIGCDYSEQCWGNPSRMTTLTWAENATFTDWWDIYQHATFQFVESYQMYCDHRLSFNAPSFGAPGFRFITEDQYTEFNGLPHTYENNTWLELVANETGLCRDRNGAFLESFIYFDTYDATHVFDGSGNGGVSPGNDVAPTPPNPQHGFHRGITNNKCCEINTVSGAIIDVNRDNRFCTEWCYCWDSEEVYGGQCVTGCEYDFNCPFASTTGDPKLTRCHQGTHQCVQCITDADCTETGFHHCDTTNTCVSFCNSDVDCNSNTDGTSVTSPFGTAVKSTQLKVCGYEGECVECLHSDDCVTPGYGFCDASFTCQLGCNEDSDCIGTQVCDVGNHTCVDCLSHDDCVNYPLHVCSNYVCTAGCILDSHCLKNYYSLSGPAVTSLTSAYATSPGPNFINQSGLTSLPKLCSPSRQCKECLHDDDCTLDGFTNTSTLKARRCSGGACVRGCNEDSDCAWPTRCFNKQCVECTSDLDCSSRPDRPVCIMRDRKNSSNVWASNFCGGVCSKDEHCRRRTPNAPYCIPDLGSGIDATFPPAANNIGFVTGICVECLHNDHCNIGFVCGASSAARSFFHTGLPTTNQSIFSWISAGIEGYGRCLPGCSSDHDCNRDPAASAVAIRPYCKINLVSATPANAPVRANATGVCVECRNDFDCHATYGTPGQNIGILNKPNPTANFTCDTTTWSCRTNATNQCIIDDDCADHFAVRGTPFCWQRTCVQCLTNSDCFDGVGVGSVCNATHSCVAANAATGGGPACVRDSDCNSTSAPFCNQNLAACVACMHHDDCPALNVSGNNPRLAYCFNSTCVVGCNDDSDCDNVTVATAWTPYCDDGNHICVQCRHHDHCSQYFTGSALNHWCTANHTCVAGLAGATSCNDNIDCLSTPNSHYCNGATHTCVECLHHDHCLNDTYSVCGPQNTCQLGCSEDKDCRNATTGHYCNINRVPSVVNPLGICVQCFHDDHCEEYITSTSATSLQLVCINNVCNFTGSGGCNHDNDCKTPLLPYCYQASCVACFHDDHCNTRNATVDPTQNICAADHTCVNKGNYPSCNTDSDCATLTIASGASVPYCNIGHKMCVECLHHDHCPGICDFSNGTAYTCLNNISGGIGNQVITKCNEDTDCRSALGLRPTVALIGPTTTAARFCDGETQNCVECLHHDDCPVVGISTSLGLSYCESGICVLGCNDDLDCVVYSAAAPNVFDQCDGRFCVECTRDDDCPTLIASAPQICGTTGSCVTGCNTDSDCTGGLLCNPRTSQCVECIAHRDCFRVAGSPEYRPRCLANYTCGRGCDRDSDCPNGSGSSTGFALRVCNGAVHECVECMVSEDCSNSTLFPGKPWCNDNYVCSQGCEIDAHCPSGSLNPLYNKCNAATHSCTQCMSPLDCPAGTPVCTGGLCIAGCNSNSDCSGATPSCNPATETCVACFYDDDCEPINVGGDWSRMICRNYTCVVGCNDHDDCQRRASVAVLAAAKQNIYCAAANNHICVACLHDDHCGGNDMICASNFTCMVGCNDNEDCTTGFVCDGAGTHLCVACLHHWECPTGQICSDMPATKNTCIAGCADSSDCTSNTMPYCSASTRTCVECLHHDDCFVDKSRRYCNDTFSCVAGCNDDTDCPDSYAGGLAPISAFKICNFGTHSCVQCLHSDDCHELTKPWCNNQHICVAGCADDSDCPTGGSSAVAKYCDGGTHSCVECHHDDHCASGFCAANWTCQDGCNTDSDCASRPATPLCDGANHVCVRCHHDDDCSVGFICNLNNTCVVGCNTNNDCTSPLKVCDRSTLSCKQCIFNEECDTGKICKNNTCVDGCDDHSDCVNAAGKFCARELKVCKQCLHNDHCSGTAGTNLCSAAYTCVTGCTTHSQCIASSPTTPWCDAGNHQCVACLHSEHCTGANRFCSLSHTCIAGCHTNNDCTSGFFCHNKHNVTGHSACIQCYKHSQCATGSFCNNNFTCVPGCTRHADCTSGANRYCNFTSRQCVAGCTQHADCPSGRFCGAGKTCVECLTSGDCQGALRYCNKNGSCEAGCDGDEDCTSNQFCDVTGSHTCVNGCDQDSDCLFGFCHLASHQCRECFVSDDCPANKPVCNELWVCVTGCVDKDDCSGGRVCDVASHKCVECLHPLDCASVPRRHYCSTSRTCVTGCYDDRDCGTNEVCDGATHQCVECLSSAHCTFNPLAPYCDPATHQCQPGCFDDSHCIIGGGTGNKNAKVCDRARKVCVECRHPRDCNVDPTLPYCDINSGKCVAGCYDDADCRLGGGTGNPNAVVCRAATHTCVECLYAHHCMWSPTLPFCDTSNGNHHCVQGCYTDKDCVNTASAGRGLPTAKFCNVAQHECVECTSHEDCNFDPYRPVCNINAVSPSCTSGCVSDSNCPHNTPICRDNICVPCRSDTDCNGALSICNFDGTCTAGCNGDADCLNPLLSLCVGQTCVQCRVDQDCNGELGLCEKHRCVAGCDSNKDCSGNTPLCRDAKCVKCTSNCPDPTLLCATSFDCSGAKPACNVARLTCVECMEDKHCPSSKPACNSATQKCTTCMHDHHCAAGTFCHSATGTCHTCLGDHHCPSATPLCISTGAQANSKIPDVGMCVQCKENSDCPEQFPTCNSKTHACTSCASDPNTCSGRGFCSPKLGFCIPCVSDDDCYNSFAQEEEATCDVGTGLCWSTFNDGKILAGVDRSSYGVDAYEGTRQGFHVAGVIISAIALAMCVFMIFLLIVACAMDWFGPKH